MGPPLRRKTDRERWLGNARRGYEIALFEIFSQASPQWGGREGKKPLRFCAPEIFCLVQVVTPVKGSGESGPMDLGGAQRSRSPSAASPAILWVLSHRWESTSPPGRRNFSPKGRLGNVRRNEVSHKVLLPTFLSRKVGGRRPYGLRPNSYSRKTQHILAPAGILSSIISRFRRSSPFSVWTAEMSMPLDSSPIIFRGGRLTMATRVLPTSSSGL